MIVFNFLKFFIKYTPSQKVSVFLIGTILIFVLLIWWTVIKKFLEKNKIVVEILAIIIAIFAIYFPIKETQRANQLANETLKLSRQEIQASHIPFLDFKPIEYYATSSTTKFMLLEIENFSDAPAIAMIFDIYIDNIRIPRSNPSFGDLMPHQKREASLSIDVAKKEQIFNGKSKLQMDLIAMDILGNIYHHAMSLGFVDGKFTQEESSFYCDKNNSICPIKFKQ